MNTVVRTNYDDGRRRSESRLSDGVPHGIHREWHRNGVLAKEIPFKRGDIEGTCRQWDKDGKLVSESKLPRGTGVLINIGDDGVIAGEMSYVNGKLNGRQSVFFNGQVVAVCYWVRNRRVSWKAYLSHCDKDGKLPRYKQNIRVSKDRGGKKLGNLSQSADGHANDAAIEALLLEQSPPEASAWLGRKRIKCTLGEGRNTQDSKLLVDRLYESGAQGVWVVDIVKCRRDEKNGRLIVRLARAKRKRSRVLDIVSEIGEHGGFEPEVDSGQEYVVMMLD